MMSQAAAPGTPIALTIAGSDSSGGAGIQADLKTFTVLGVYGASVITALTAQNTRGVQAIETIRPAFVLAQLDSVMSDLNVKGIKTGMLATAEIVSAVAARLKNGTRCPLVIDPVMVATSGDVLLPEDAIGAMRRELVPLASLLTPNLPEAARLLGTSQARSEEDVVMQAQALQALGPRAVLVKGGHNDGDTSIDYLCDGNGIQRFELPRVDTEHTHGTGCVLSAAITALLAQGIELKNAVERAKRFVWEGLQQALGLGIGQGKGPVDTLFAIRRVASDA